MSNDSSCQPLVTTRVDLIRHGEPQGGNVFRGKTNLPLTEQGRWQFRQRLQRYGLQSSSAHWQQIISSPLQRCLESAEYLAQELSIPLLVEPLWQEIDYGDWENRPVNEVMATQPLQAQKMWQQPLEFCAPNGEPVRDFQQRILNAWQTLLADHRGQHLLLVSHGGVMRVLAQHLLSLAPQAMNRLSIPYAGLMRFRVDHDDNQDWVSLEMMDGSTLDQAQDKAGER